MISFPNAKLNIGLRVTGVRSDGFRNLESCFYPVQWCDALEILPAEKTTFRLSGIPVPGNESTNLCLKAYELLMENHKLAPVGMQLHKNIPIGAGMGGGSADAAFTLKMLNDLFSLNLPETELEDYARQLGSDCAFFIRNKPVLAIGKGDEFEPLNLDLKGYTCLVVYPDLHITTAEAYSHVKPNKPETDLATLLQQDISTWNVTGFYDDKNQTEELINGFPHLGSINDLNQVDEPLCIVLAIGDCLVKKKLLQRISNPHLSFVNLIHPSVKLAEFNFCTIGEGTLIFDQTILTVNITVGKHVLLSPGCKIAHDAVIGDFCSFMYSVHLAGNTTIADSVYIGNQATILQQLSVGSGSIIGAGAVVTRSLPATVTAVGVPAHIIKNHASPLL